MEICAISRRDWERSNLKTFQFFCWKVVEGSSQEIASVCLPMVLEGLLSPWLASQFLISVALAEAVKEVDRTTVTSQASLPSSEAPCHSPVHSPRPRPQAPLNRTAL